MRRLLALALLLVSPATAADLTITWTDNSSNELGFRIERRLGSGPVGLYDTVTTVGINVVSYVDTGLAPSTQYCYRIVALNEFGENVTAEECDTTGAAGAVTITTETLPNARVGVAYTAPAMGCQGGDGGPYTYDVTAGTLPSAIALAAGGTWSGTPGAGTAGDHVITIRCRDTALSPGTRQFTLTVLPNLPVILTLTLPNGVDNTAYTAPIEASCPLPPCVLSKTTGTYCVGTDLTDTSPPGAITGTPTTPEVCNFTLRVTDNLTQTADQALTMSVEAAAFTVSVSVNPSSNGAVVTYGADDLDTESNCLVALLNDGDIIATYESLSGPTFRQATFLNLTPSTEYSVEVDCDDAASVVTVEFETLHDPQSGSLTATLRVKPNAILSGVVSVLVQWGEESLGTFENETTEACASGCVVDVGPIDRNKIYLLRFSWLDASDNVIASSQIPRRIVP